MPANLENSAVVTGMRKGRDFLMVLFYCYYYLFLIFCTWFEVCYIHIHSICQQSWKTQQWRQAWKRSVFIPIPKKGNAKECSNCHTIALISHAGKVMLKILWARLQQYVNCEIPDVQYGFRKGRGTRDPLADIIGSSKKQESSRKTSISALLTMQKPLTVWTTTNSGKFWKKGNTKLPDLPLEESVCRSGSNS